MLLLALFLACAPEPPGPEPLDLPDDPGATGVPVGVRTVVADDLVLEVFYPAADGVRGAPTERVDLRAFIPAEVEDLLGAVDLPRVDGGAVRDAPFREPEAPYPVLLFSHGFGGFRSQSTALTSHLASRGYVVVAPDHVGRRLADVLPCVFSPPLEGCSIALEDPAAEDLPAALTAVDRWVEEGGLAGTVDTTVLGLLGHSAGANSTANVGSDEPRFQALLPMSGSAPVTADVPALFAAGTCDAVLPAADSEAAWTASAEGSAEARYLALDGAGHLAFSDLCGFDLGRLADEVLAPREDVGEVMLGMLRDLAVDGCPGYTPPEDLACGDAYLPLEDSDAALRHYATAFFDEALRGTGPGLQAGLFPAAELR